MKRLVVIFVIISSLFGIAGCGSALTDVSENHQFNYYAECTTKEQLAALEKESFVDSIFPFSLLIFERPVTTSDPRQIAYYGTESFDKIDASSFERSEIIEEDISVLSNNECNPIIISSSLANDEHLSIGDTMEQPCKLTEQPLTFTVGAIYRHESLFAQYEAVILLNEDNNAVLFSAMNEAGYTNAYIKASDADKLDHYFEEEFIPGMLLQDYTPEELAALSREDISPYYEDYITHINRMK